MQTDGSSDSGFGSKIGTGWLPAEAGGPGSGSQTSVLDLVRRAEANDAISSLWHPPILIIDGDEAEGSAVAEHLRREGFEPTLCTSARAGLRAARNGGYSVIVNDLHLFGRSGSHLLERLARLPGSPPMIVYTAYGSFDSARRSINCGVFAYLQKGCDPEELVLQVHRAIHRKARADLMETESRYRTLVEHAPDSVLILQAGRGYEPVIMEANPRAGQLLGTEHPLLAGSDLTRFSPARQPDGSDSHRRLSEHLRRALGGEVFSFEWMLEGAGGRAVPCEVRLAALPPKQRREIWASIIDISERKRAEEALRLSEQRYRALYDDNPSMYFTIDASARVVSANRFGVEQLGFTQEEVLGMAVADLCSAESAEEMLRQVETCFSDPTSLCAWEVSLVRRDGSRLWVKVAARVVAGTQGSPQLLVVCQDGSEERELSEVLSYQASHDALTSLVNRRELERRLDRCIAMERTADGDGAFLLYLDLDQFKIVNDSCGHEAGDKMLQLVSEILSKNTRARDTVARLGGDEFAVLIGGSSIEGGLRVAENLRQAISDIRFPWGDQVFAVGVSIGLVAITPELRNVVEVLKAADSACYAAKEKGRNQIHVYCETDSEVTRRAGELRWVSGLWRAIEEDRLRLWHQPIRPLSTWPDDDRLSFEVLLRMEMADGEIESASSFLPAVERYHMSSRVDAWVVASTLDHLQERPDLARRLDLCCVNLSAQSLANEKLRAFIERQLERDVIPPDKLCFEITETAAIMEMAKAIRFVEALKERGCRFALDDFGSGLSSFGYLRNLPVDFLKIDGSIVQRMLDHPLDLAMVCSISDIAQVLGKETIAEYVESEEMIEQLQNLGVSYGQGFALGGPRPFEDLGDRS
ncbi:MAG: EAL domain-containing protein [Holophagales bacterium]|nr:EAL domain-containing protein [Holophagales bacterium]